MVNGHISEIIAGKRKIQVDARECTLLYSKDISSKLRVKLDDHEFKYYM